MIKSDIYTTILDEIRSFEHDRIKITDTYTYNQYETVNRIINYDASKFESGEYDSENFRKFFYNVSNWRAILAAKQIDFDTKDIMAISENDESYYATFFFLSELKYWMRTNKIGRLINEICWNLPRFGSVVLKKFQNKLDLVDLRNFKNDPAAKYLSKARYINEIHYYSPYELYQMSDVWNKDAIEKVCAKYELRSPEYASRDIKVYERYGEVKEGWLDKYSTTPNKIIKGCFVVADVDYYMPTSEDNAIEKYAILDSKEYDVLPYEEGHWIKMLGRWLAVGVVESLFDAQIRENELTNIKSKGLWWSGKKLYQTRDDIVSKNLLTDVSDGDILTVKSEITPIANEDRNLSAFAQEERRWDNLETLSTFSHESLRGEPFPAATPLGSVYMQQQMASGFFELKREDVGMFFKDVIMNQVIPIFEEEKYEEHVFTMAANSAEELNKFEENVINYRHLSTVVEFIKKNRRVPTFSESDFLKRAIVSRIRNKKERYIGLPKGFYKDLKYRFSLVITGESINVQTKIASLQVVLQFLMSNPNLLEDPFVRKTLFQMLNYAGIDPTDYMTEKSEGLPGEELLGLGAPTEKSSPVSKMEELTPQTGSPPRLRLPTTIPAMSPEEKTIY